MSHSKIIRMANQIAIFFESASDTAVEETADHINNFWEPRMRAELFELADQNPDALHKNVVQGLRLVRPVAETSAPT